ncbi:MAG: C45 family autoproteolytic acyltransferase/hydrolase [Bacteroidetes bacterium]|nr:C45 family autoproteolytic acyltransferase/hydrolase [Bacteroidota bacterium]
MSKLKHRWIRRSGVVLVCTILVIILFSVAFYFSTRIQEPKPAETSVNLLAVENRGADDYRIGVNRLKKNPDGLWEMYVEGKPYQRGVIAGKLSKQLIEIQEQAFIDQIRKMIPSDFYLRFLKYFIGWFNRDLDEYLTDEYKEEIFGISLSASPRFSFIGSNYQRMLNYHSAHDVGHALQDFALVGCTSFGVWDSKSKDSSLIVGRNFDFYVGDKFAENKIVCFEKPDKGYPFMMVTWGGMIGAVSGMNEKGLTVTINAAKSDIPGSARTPISILAREILQYAQNISEAWSIAKKRQTFVSESILIGSAQDHQAAIIEKSPFKIAIVKSSSDYIACANHFQSPVFANDPLNIRNKNENASVYRYKRLIQDITNSIPLDYKEAANILRDQRGLNNKNIGMGNEKAMNQLISHHSIIFSPEKLLVWVSTAPWQLGSYTCYDLDKIFHNFAALRQDSGLSVKKLMIPSDPFLESDDYKHFMRFRELREALKKSIQTGQTDTIESSFIDEFTATNPNFYETFSLTGDYYRVRKQWENARNSYLRALELEVPRWNEKLTIIKKLTECNANIRSRP